MVCYYEPIFMEKVFRESVFFFNFRGIAQSREMEISKMAAILKRYSRFSIFFLLWDCLDVLYQWPEF